MPRKSKEQLRKERQYKATTKYERKVYKKFLLRLSILHDADIIDALNKVPSKNAFIKECIRKNLDK